MYFKSIAQYGLELAKLEMPLCMAHVAMSENLEKIFGRATLFGIVVGSA